MTLPTPTRDQQRHLSRSKTAWRSAPTVRRRHFWFKGQQMGTGQCPVKRYNRHLRNLIAEDKVKPSWIVSYNLPLEQGPDAYKHFDAREDGWTKVVLNPGQTT